MKKQKPQIKKKKIDTTDPLDRDMSFVFDDPKKWQQFHRLFQFAPKDKTICLW